MNFSLRFMTLLGQNKMVKNKFLKMLSTTVANEFGSDMLRRFGGLQSLLSPPAHVLSSSPHSQDSIEW